MSFHAISTIVAIVLSICNIVEEFKNINFQGVWPNVKTVYNL